MSTKRKIEKQDGSTPESKRAKSAENMLETLDVVHSLLKGDNVMDKSIADKLDNEDPLKDMRKEFYIPQHEHGGAKRDMLYFCGNSLGLQPKRTEVYVQEELEKWKQQGVEGHFNGKRPWLTIDDEVAEKCCALLGAEKGEVAILNSLTTNLHLLMVPFYRPTEKRFKILIEKQPFPSDLYAMQSQLQFHGLDPSSALVQLGPREGEYFIRTEDIVAKINELGDSLALVMWPGVQYYTGQYFELAKLAHAAHNAGAIIGIDLAHAVGNASLRLHEWGVDFAAFCTYKYLNSGPGSIGGMFVHSSHGNAADRPRFAGWWGHDLSTRFDMRAPFSPITGAYGYRLSNPPVLQTVSLLASLDTFEQAGGIAALRKKSIALTSYLERLLRHCIDEKHLTIMTPSDVHQRGCQLSLLFHEDVNQVHKELEQSGVIVDYREPACIRVSPTPLYNTFNDVREFVHLLSTSLKKLQAENLAKKKQ